MDYRCPNHHCRKILFRGELVQGMISVKCPRCGTLLNCSVHQKKPRGKVLSPENYSTC
ncbi:MAG TPA: hypothetical protein DDY86_12315, partial [Syntrophaceae bacterium]|nr:hypothetical protein [Syntrophaceae bacterium]